MSNLTSQTKASQVEFIQYHQPKLKSGKYHIKVEQTISGTGPKGSIPDETSFSRDLTFAVTGERFSPLTPQDIYAVFPPAGSLGDHFNVLPHITLNRSTLPWERSPEVDNPESTLPWLALLLFRESQQPQIQTMTLQELENTSNYQARFPKIKLEPGHHQSDRVAVIDVPQSILKSILPHKSDLAYLAHVRQPKIEDQALGEELATVICNRLPNIGEMSIVHLVSVEGRYNQNNDQFNYPNPNNDDDLIRLVSLKSWRFFCRKEGQNFTELLLDLDLTPETLRLPDSGNPDADKYLSIGYTPLRHDLRSGDQTVSWYHSPFSPGETSDTVELPVRTADELIRYNPTTKMFDVSYASAWELGRLLTLHNKGVSISLYNWKRDCAQNLKQKQQEVLHLPLQGQLINTDIPEAIANWFRDLSLLKGIPFDYLVPDERLLPVESIRFFRVDPLWVECLLDGAFSIGRVTFGDLHRDQDNPSGHPYGSLSGFVLRSDVVSGWPSLIVDGYDEIVMHEDFVPTTEKLPLLRMERLSANVLLCLFNGEIKTVDIHLKPEAMHFGIDVPTEAPTKFHKELRNPQGKSLPKLDLDTIPWKDPEQKVIDITGLAGAIEKKLHSEKDQTLTPTKAFTSAQFALEMIEGVQKVRFPKCE